MSEEKVEQEHDADSLKPSISEYLKMLTIALAENHDDVEELARIHGRIAADKTILESLSTKIGERRTHLTNLVGKTSEIRDLIARSVAERE